MRCGGRRQTDRRFAEEGTQRNRGKEPATVPGARGPPGMVRAALPHPGGLLIGQIIRLFGRQ